MRPSALTTVLTLASAFACSAHDDTTPDAAVDSGVSADAGELDAGVDPIHLGFNAQGNVNVPEQVAYAQTMLQQLSPAQRAGMLIRVLGGTASQRLGPGDWSDADIMSWVSLESSTGIGLSFTVNGNDSAASQRAFYDHWVSLGAKFRFIEMMNEYYLPKYTKGDTSNPEVTRAVNADDYVTSILPEYFSAFSGVGLRFFVILAPVNPAATGSGNAAWNDTVISHLGSFGDVPLGVTIHLYKVSDLYDYNQVDQVVARLPSGMPVAITESGLLDPSVVNGAGYAQAATDHLSAIFSKLRPGDFLLDQVLYGQGAEVGPDELHPKYGGITPKGQAVVTYFKGVARPLPSP